MRYSRYEDGIIVDIPGLATGNNPDGQGLAASVATAKNSLVGIPMHTPGGGMFQYPWVPLVLTRPSSAGHQEGMTPTIPFATPVCSVLAAL